MPVLRSGPDNTLAETLGNLGSSLASGLNPMNQIRANNMQSEIQQRNWELQQKQSMDAANRNAANVFYNSDLPFDPSTKEMIASQLRNGTLNVTSYIDALTKTGSLKANQAAADMYRATHGSLSPADLESNVAELIGGRKTAAELDAQESNTGLTIKKNAATISGADAAAAAVHGSTNAAPGTEELARSEAYSDPAKTAELLAKNRVRGLTGNLTPAQTDTAQADTQAAGYPRVPLGTAVTVAGQPAADADAAARAAEAKRQADVAETLVKGVPRTGNIIPGPMPGSPGNTIGAPYNANPTPDAAGPAPAPVVSADGTVVAPPSKDVFLPNTETPANLPVPVERSLPGGKGTIVGETEAEAQARQKTDTETASGVKDDIGAGESGQNMMAILDRLNTLADLSGTATTGGQFSAAVINKLREYHIVATNRAGLLAEMQSLFQAQIPELRKAMGVKFEAGPELSAQGKMIGDASLPVEVLKGIFARQATVAKLGIGLRDLAIRASQPGQAKPLTRTEYLAQRAALYDNLTNEMRQQVKDYGGYSKETLAPPKPPPATTGNSVMDSIKALLRHMGGADEQPPTPAPAPNNATEVIDVDANGRVFRR